MSHANAAPDGQASAGVERIGPGAAMPEKLDVVVIGGGIVGITTALYLAQKGIAVAVCEKGRVGHEQSGRNWGWIRIMGRDPGEIPLALESQRLWEAMGPAIGADGAADLAFDRVAAALERVGLSQQLVAEQGRWQSLEALVAVPWS